MAKGAKTTENGSGKVIATSSKSRTKIIDKENLVRKRRPYVKVNFTDAEKKELAGLIKLKQVIWRLDDPQHRIGNYVEKAWTSVAAAMNRPVNDCRKGWRSLVDALRRKKRMQPLGKSGDSANESEADEGNDLESQNESTLEAWEFYEHLKFLEETQAKRKTISSLSKTVKLNQFPRQNMEDDDSEQDIGGKKSDDETTDFEYLFDDQVSLMDFIDTSENGNGESESEIQNVSQLATAGTSHSQMTKKPTTSGKSESVYNYMLSESTKANKGKLQPTVDPATECLMSGLTEIINLEKAETSAKSQPNKNLQYFSMWSNLDRMFKKLPEDSVENLNMQFINMAYYEMKKIEDAQVISININTA